MRILRFLRGGVNQTRIRRRILRLEFLHGLKVRRVSDDFGKLLQLVELSQFRYSLFLFSNSSAHNNSPFGLCNSPFGLCLERTPRLKNRQRQSLSSGPRVISPGQARTHARRVYAETVGRASAVRFEPSAALTKLFPSSRIGPGNLRHSVSTSSSAFTNMSTSFSAMINGGKIFITSIAWPATWVRMRCLLSICVTIICAKSTLSILCNSFHAIFSLNSCGS